MGQLHKIEPELIELGYQIIAISPDRPEKLQASISKHKLNYRLLSDSKMLASRAFGIAFRVDEKYNKLLKGYGIDLAESSGEDHGLLPVPAVFLVGTDGTITFSYANPNHRVRIQPEVLLAAAKASKG